MMAAMEEKKTSAPEFRSGDTVKVFMKVKEGDSERVQVFEGTVIVRRGRGAGETFTVRKVSFGVGVERTFPRYSPHIEKIELVRTGRVRRARLYYLRDLAGKAARLDERASAGPSVPTGASAGPSASSVAPTSQEKDPESAKPEPPKLELRKAKDAPPAVFK